jgi:hypothetical protein
LADFAKHTEKYLKITGIQWVENWWTFNLDMLETYKANAPSVRCFGHQGTQGGRNLWLPDCTPVASADDPPDHKSLWYAQLDPPMDEDPIDGIVARITRFAATKTPPFFITVYDTPKHVMNYAQICKRDLPGNFQIVRLEDFIDLMSQACPFSADEASDTQGDEEEDQAEKQTEDL